MRDSMGRHFPFLEHDEEFVCDSYLINREHFRYQTSEFLLWLHMHDLLWANKLRYLITCIFLLTILKCLFKTYYLYQDFFKTVSNSTINYILSSLDYAASNDRPVSE
jgi:putative flippase GtrA